jgi:hypothetical protein
METLTSMDEVFGSRNAKALAERFAAETPELVTAKMTKALRQGKVFIDWSQNNPAKTTIASYSQRRRDQPTVFTGGRFSSLRWLGPEASWVARVPDRDAAASAARAVAPRPDVLFGRHVSARSDASKYQFRHDTMRLHLAAVHADALMAAP